MIIKEEKLKLSPYFDEILNHHYGDDNFELIFDNSRLELIKKITDFWESEKIFYVIMGSDGIGKTTTLLYFISFIHDYQILYLNLKLFYERPKEEVENIFFEELKRVFFIDKNNYSTSLINYKYKSYRDLKSSILKNLKDSNISGIEFMWELLKEFILHFRVYGVFNSSTLLIIDQYKNDKIDDKVYSQLNKICYLIDENNNKYSTFYNLKLILMISINNFDTKKMFLENINITFFNSNINNNINLKEQNEINNTYEQNYELLDIGKYLDEKYEKINKAFNDKLSKLEYNISPTTSYCYLNLQYFQKTKKEYLNYNTNCKKLIPKIFGNDFQNCIKAFDYSMKYFELLMIEINENKKEDNESIVQYEKRISNLFYNKMYNKIKYNIYKCYNKITKEKKKIIFTDLEAENLIQLRNYIYEEKTFLIYDLENLLINFPVKYLNIFFSCFEEISKKEIDIDDINFCFTYSNLFVKHAFNKIIKNYLQAGLFHDFDGIYFEKMVNDKLLKFRFHNNDVIKRNIFSLVGITKSSNDYVKKLREKENSEFINFYGLKRYNIVIDDIDKDKLKEANLDIINNDIFLNQISKNGRSFDAGLLIKKNETNGEGTHDLIVFQDTINKVKKCKSKEKYIDDSINSKNHLENVYIGLKIDKIYFIFIIPENYPNIDKTIAKLDLYKIYYVYFSLSSGMLFKTKNNIISDFRIDEANIDISYQNFSLRKSISNINFSRYIIKESIKKYFMKRKINNNKSFIDVYNKISLINFHECIKLSIPPILKKNIIKIFLKENLIQKGDKLNFIPSSNYQGLEFENIYKNTNNMIIFSYASNIYLYYYYYFKISDKFEIQKITQLNIIEPVNCKSPTNDINDLDKIKLYPLFCFCFNIFKNYNFD